MSNSWYSKSSSPKPASKTNDDVDFLLKTVEEQKEQLTRFQNKFRGNLSLIKICFIQHFIACFLIQDLTSAYKSVLAEKQALEITLKALKTKNNILTPNKKNEQSNLVSASNSGLSASSRSVSDASEQETNDPTSKSEFKAATKTSSDSEDAEARIAALTSNIQLLLENKSKMEAGYQAEKKKLLVDSVFL
jgi:hypothetical protein